ncbi:hypothetical protein H6P81_017093 [Aristolochia fimbriata]|uniref:Uncharacterized protein n=1 Tax=Aristolochia fimbriata TaxID=158543 RepID=A0AAV7DY58_ARIFI|nr:hypothetical protein H6P81_017093 [Aristolochia fimbriata]
MAKKKKAGGIASGFHCTTLREESSGRKEIKGSKDVNSMLKLQHLQKLATWASGEASLPPLGALLGHSLASGGESLGIPLDPSILQCQRCETILQPAYNCTVRIEKVTAKAKRHKKSSNLPQNNVVYTCHFCSHRNLKRGTPRGYMKEIQAARNRTPSESNCSDSGLKIVSSMSETVSGSKLKGSSFEHVESSPVTPMQKTDIMTANMKLKSGQGSTKSTGFLSNATITEQVKENCGSSRRRKRGWSSLKEIAESSEQANKRKLDNLTIPFFM